MHYNSHLYCTIFGAALQDICGAVFFIPNFLGKSIEGGKRNDKESPEKEKRRTAVWKMSEVQVYLYTDDKGKRHYKSFVAPSRKEAKEMATRWKLDMKDKPIEQYNEPDEDEDEDITVNQAIERYLNAERRFKPFHA